MITGTHRGLFEKNWTTALLVLLLFGFLGQGRGSEVGFETSGTVTCRYEKTQETRVYEFAFRYRDGSYYVKVTPRISADVNLMAIECTFDGTGAYLSRTINTNVSEAEVYRAVKGKLVSSRVEGPLPVVGSTLADIGEGPRPPGDEDPITLLWLAFAAQDQYNCTKEVADRPLFFLGWFYDKFRLKVATRARATAHPPGFLEYLDQFHEGSRFSGGTEGLRKTPLASPFQAGYTNCIFGVTEWEQNSGRSFPKHFVLISLNPDTDSAQFLRTNVTCEGTADEIRVSPMVLSSPSRFPANTRVVEARETVTGLKVPVTYKSESGRILNAQEIKRTSAYRDQGGSRAVPPWKRLVFTFLIGCVAVWPAFLMVRRKLRQPKSIK